METDEKQKHHPMSKRVNVEISPEVISDSVERDSSHCMIAEAVRSAVPGAQRISVDLQTIRFTDSKRGLRYTYLTPRLAQIALIQFDQGITPEPFKFQLRGGQVTQAGSAQKRRGEPESKKTGTPENTEKARKTWRATLVNRNAKKGNIPDVVGGKTPPMMPFGRRRAFGLRALER